MNPYPDDSHPPQSQDTLLKVEVLRLLYGGLPASLLANVLLSILLTTVQWSVINTTLAGSWLAFLGIILTFRALIYLGYRRATSKGSGSSYSFLWLFRLGTIATGVAWGMHAYLLFPENNIGHQVFLASVLAGVSFGAITALSADRVSALDFCYRCAGPGYSKAADGRRNAASCYGIDRDHLFGFHSRQLFPPAATTLREHTLAS